jgi:hypothetical protein
VNFKIRQIKKAPGKNSFIHSFITAKVPTFLHRFYARKKNRMKKTVKKKKTKRQKTSIQYLQWLD